MKKLTGYKPLNLDEISDKRDIFSRIKDKINHMRYGFASADIFGSLEELMVTIQIVCCAYGMQWLLPFGRLITAPIWTQFP